MHLSAIQTLRSCLILGILLVFGCTGGYHKRGPVQSSDPQRGLASWYGPSFHGKPSASGEPYDMWALTAAHRTLPFGTWVQVRSIDTGKSVTVRITDRGPFIRGRVIDLSYVAARELAMIGRGTVEVVLTIVNSPNGSTLAQGVPKNFWVQAGAFTTLTEAMTLQQKLAHHYPRVRVKTVELSSGQWHRVQVGTFHSEKQAEAVVKTLRKQLGSDPLLIQDN